MFIVFGFTIGGHRAADHVRACIRFAAKVFAVVLLSAPVIAELLPGNHQHATIACSR